MDFKDVRLSREGRVALVRFDRGDKLNALSLGLLQELTLAARSFEGDLQTSVVVLSGAGQAFSAGLDLRDPDLGQAMAAPLDQRREAFAWGPRMCRAWAEMDQVTIAAVEGFCVGGGVSLAAACDFRLLGQGAHFRIPELTLGFNMSWQTLPRLAHLVGPARAKRIVLLAERIAADQALAWGLADEIVPDGQVEAAALALAEKIAAQPPLPVKMTKKAVNAAVGALDEATSFMDLDQFTLTQMSEDHAEGLAAFEEKRPPRFKGR